MRRCFKVVAYYTQFCEGIVYKYCTAFVHAEYVTLSHFIGQHCGRSWALRKILLQKHFLMESLKFKGRPLSPGHPFQYIYVTGSGKTGLIHTSTEIQFSSTSERYTHALPRNTKYLAIDDQVCFYRRLFADAVKP